MKIPFRGSGQVCYKDREYKCSLYYTEEGGVIVLKIHYRSDLGIGNYLELPLEIDELSGKLDSGYEFTLLGLTRGGMEDYLSAEVTTYTYYAEYLLSGIKNLSSEAQTFSKVNFVLADIVEWGGESIYDIGEEFELKAKHEPVSKTVYACKNYSIFYKVRGSVLPITEYDLLKEDIDLKQHGIIEIAFSKETAFKEFVETFNKLKRLFEVALRRTVQVEKMYAFSNKIMDIYEDTSFERKIDIYGSNVNAVDSRVDREKSWQHKWIMLSSLIDNNSIGIYFDKHDKLQPVIDLYLESFYLKGNSVTRTFLNVVQALETYHSRFITNDLSKFRKRFTKLSNGLPPQNAEYLKRFIMASSEKNKKITLESRLADLIYANGEVYFDTGDIRQIEFPAVVARTRNYYIHYDEKIKKKYRILSIEELGIYNSLLYQLLEYYILVELQFSSEERNKMIFTRWSNAAETQRILKASRRKK